jgi:hypothetical protein
MTTISQSHLSFLFIAWWSWLGQKANETHHLLPFERPFVGFLRSVGSVWEDFEYRPFSFIPFHVKILVNRGLGPPKNDSITKLPQKLLSFPYFWGKFSQKTIKVDLTQPSLVWLQKFKTDPSVVSNWAKLASGTTKRVIIPSSSKLFPQEQKLRGKTQLKSGEKRDRKGRKSRLGST